MTSPKPPRWLKPANKLMVALTSGHKSRRVTIIELSAEEARPVLRAFPAEVPVGVGFLKRSGLVAQGTAAEVEALAGRTAVFRFDP